MDLDVSSSIVEEERISDIFVFSDVISDNSIAASRRRGRGLNANVIFSVGILILLHFLRIRVAALGGKIVAQVVRL